MRKPISKSAAKAARPKMHPLTVICRFTVKPAHEKDFVRVLSRDWPNLLRLGLATKDEPVVYRHLDATGGPVYFQIFSWVNEAAVGRAHTMPEVMQSWTSMDPFLEERGGHKKCEFPHVETVSMNWVRPGAFLR